MVLKTGNGIIQTGNDVIQVGTGIISPTYWAPIKKLHLQNVSNFW